MSFGCGINSIPGGISSPPEPPSVIISVSIGPDGNDAIPSEASTTSSVFCGGAPNVCAVACTSGIDGGIKAGGNGGDTGGGDDTTTGGLGLVAIAAAIFAAALPGADVSVAGGVGGGVGLVNGAGGRVVFPPPVMT